VIGLYKRRSRCKQMSKYPAPRELARIGEAIVDETSKRSKNLEACSVSLGESDRGARRAF